MMKLMSPEERHVEAMKAVLLAVAALDGDADVEQVCSMARMPGPRGGFRPINRDDVLFLLGMLAGMDKIVPGWVHDWEGFAAVKWRVRE